MFAEQAGVDGMGYPWDGDWCDEDASDYDEEYLPSHREDVLFDLEDGGRGGRDLGGRQLRSSRLWRGRTAAGGTTGTESSYCTCTCSTTRLMAASFGRLACASRCAVSGQTAVTAPARPQSAAMSDRDD